VLGAPSGASGVEPGDVDRGPVTAPVAQEPDIWRPEEYFFAEAFLITTRLFPPDPSEAAAVQTQRLARAMWAWAAMLNESGAGMRWAVTTLIEASILESDGEWEAFDQYRLCLGVAAWGRRASIWNQVGRCYSPAKDPYGLYGPDPMVGFASAFWAFRTDNPSRHYGWRTDANLGLGRNLVQASAMLTVNDEAVTRRGQESIEADRLVANLVWRFPVGCRALGLLNVSFQTKANHYGAVHAACQVWGSWEWGAGAVAGGPGNENGHGLQILNKVSRSLPEGRTVEFFGTGTMSFLRWAGASGRLYSLGGEGTWRFANGFGVTAGALHIWLDRSTLAEGSRRGQTESEFFMNVSVLYD
jgi:hypothetical protein